MYAVIEQGGKQHKVEKGDWLDLELMDIAEGAKTIELDKVLLVADGDNIQIGKPYLEGAKVIASLGGGGSNEAIVKGPKLFPMHFRRRKESQRRIGHRQKHLRVTIEEIKA